LEFGTNCDDTLKEVSPLTNHAAQDLLLLKEPPAMVVVGEMENEITEELSTEHHFEGNKSLQISDKYDDNKPTSVANHKPASVATDYINKPAPVTNDIATPQSTTATLLSTMQSITATVAIYREKPKIGRKPTASRKQVKITKTKATKTKVTQSGNDPIVRGGSVGAKHMKKIAKPSTRASARALITLASDHHIADHEKEQDADQELDLLEKLAKAAMHKSGRKKFIMLFLLKKKLPPVMFLISDNLCQREQNTCKEHHTHNKPQTTNHNAMKQNNK